MKITMPDLGEIIIPTRTIRPSTLLAIIKIYEAELMNCGEENLADYSRILDKLHEVRISLGH